MHEYIQGIRKHFARCPGRAGGVNHYFHDRKQCPGGYAGIGRPEYALQNALFEYTTQQILVGIAFFHDARFCGRSELHHLQGEF